MSSIDRAGYVEVADEPLHVEVFRSRRFRAYVAAIPPGTATLYHRHAEDTVYVVVDGGGLRTELRRGSAPSPMVLPRSFSLPRRICLALRYAVTGSVVVPDGMFFAMLNARKETIHRATASIRNRGDLRLMGVEVLRDRGTVAPARPGAPARRAGRLELRTGSLHVRTLDLPPGTTTGAIRFGAPVFAVCTAGCADAVVADDADRRRLGRGDFFSTDGGAPVVLRTGAGAPLRMIVIGAGSCVLSAR